MRPSSSPARPAGWTSWAASPTIPARWSCSGRSARPRASRAALARTRISHHVVGRGGHERRCDVPLDLVADGTPAVRRVRAWFAADPDAALGGVRRRRVSCAGARACRRASTTARRSSSSPTCRKAKASARRRRSRRRRWRRCSRRGALRDRAAAARGPLPAGREPDRRRAVRRHGSDGHDLRRGRQPDGAALSAGGVPGQRRGCPTDSPSGASIPASATR